MGDLHDHIFFISQENSDFSVFEAETLCNRKCDRSSGKLLFFDSLDLGAVHHKDLAFTKKINRVILSDSIDSIADSIKDIDSNILESSYKGSFSVRIVDMRSTDAKKSSRPFSEKDIARQIYRKLKSPEVSISAPETRYEIVLDNDLAYLTSVAFENEEDFDSRKAQNRPEHHPTSIHPRIARGCVNLLDARKTDHIYDPFCGSGGILIEAGLMGYRVVGSDIDRIMLNRSRINLEHYGIDGFELKIDDATSFEEEYRCIIADPPYGKNTRERGLDMLYSKFVKNLKRRLVYRAVIIYNSVIDVEGMIDESIFEIKFRTDFYIHKNMTRKVIVIEKI